MSEFHSEPGLASLLEEVSPFIAYAAIASHQSASNQDGCFSIDLEELKNASSFLPVRLKYLRQQGVDQTDLDDSVQKWYNFEALEAILDNDKLTGLPRSAKFPPNYRVNSKIARFPALHELCKYANCESLEIFKAMRPDVIGFINCGVRMDSVDCLDEVLTAHQKLDSHLKTLTQRRDSTPKRPWSESEIHDNSKVADLANTEHDGPRKRLRWRADLANRDREHDSPRQRLRLLHDTLHRTWPEHLDCSNHSKLSECLWTGCSSARLRLNFWSGEARSYDVLLCKGDDTFHECEIEVCSNIQEAEAKLAHGWLPVCDPQSTPTEDRRLSIYAAASKMLWNANIVEETNFNWQENHELKLREFIPFNELRYSERLVLAVTLARALLHLLDSDWLGPYWGMQDISILCEKDSQERKISLRTVYIATHFKGLDKKNVHTPARNLQDVHCQPQIRSLGIVIMQILLGDRLRDKLLDPSRPFRLANDLYEECLARFPKNSHILKAVANCKDGSLFRGDSSKGYETYYAKVVKILEHTLLEEEGLDLDKLRHESVHTNTNAWVGSKTSRLETQPTSNRSSLDVQSSYPQVSPAKQVESQSKPRYILAEFVEDAAPGNTTAWDQERSKLRHYFNAGRRVPIISPVIFERLIKIAILDTGCAPGHHLIKHHLDGWSGKVGGQRTFQYQQPGVWDFKDFVEEPDSQSIWQGMKDTSENLHGTFMTHLVLDTMPWTRVYIARVFDGPTTTDPLTADRVEKALDHAANTWKVDIISMSFHLLTQGDDELSGVRRAILDAASKGVLLFAAAGNSLHANVTSLGFPASDPNVICVNSHGGNARSSGETPLKRDGCMNFAALGQSLRGPGRDNTEVYMNGTSCAAPIAAAYAAMALDFVELCRDSKIAKDEATQPLFRKGVRGLHDVQVMMQVFWNLMLEEGVRKPGEYNVLKPQILFKTEFPTEDCGAGNMWRVLWDMLKCIERTKKGDVLK